MTLGVGGKAPTRAGVSITCPGLQAAVWRGKGVGENVLVARRDAQWWKDIVQPQFTPSTAPLWEFAGGLQAFRYWR